MKKFLSLTLVAIMLLSTLMLTSCDPVESVKGFFNKALGKEEVKNEARTTITEIEWRQALKITNFTLKIESDGMQMGMAVADTVIDYNYLGLKFIKDVKTGVIVAESDGVYYGGNLGDDIMPFGDDFSLGEIGYFYGIDFEDLKYNEDAGVYTAEDESSLFEFHFKDGKLDYSVMLPSDPKESGKMEVTNVGTTVVKMPEYIDVTDGKIEPNKADKNAVTTVTEEQFKNAFETPNLTLTASILFGKMIIKMDETSMSYNISLGAFGETSEYKTKIDGVTYTIKLDYYTGGYIAVPDSSDDEDLGSIDDVKFSDLVYNQVGRYYEAKTDEVKYYIYFENGKLTQIVMIGDAMGVGVDMEIICNISDVGTTKVDIPEYTVRDYLVDESQWNANLNALNYTYNAYGYSSMNIDGEYSYESISVDVQCAENGCVKVEDYENSYVAFVDGVIYNVIYNEDDGTYVATEQYKGSFSDYEIEETVPVYLFSDYSLYTYDSVNDAYKYTFDDTYEGYTCNYSYYVYFENDVITKITYNVDMCDLAGNVVGNAYAIVVFTNVGTTVVELPEFVIAD